MVFVQVKLLNEEATKPTKAHRSDAGYDLYASEDAVITSKTQSTICEFAGIITLVAVAASATPDKPAAKVCAITS